MAMQPTRVKPTTNLATLPTTSPVQVMDWEAKLKRGDENAQTRGVGQNELVSKQLTALTASDSQYIQQARDRANNEASGRGMMLSSMAGGNATRAAIDAALPIAQQDAGTYSLAARDNMAATNTDRLADQQMFGNLVGQEVGIRANLAEAERGRGFTASENRIGREHESSESLLGRQHATQENVASRHWQGSQSALQRGHEANMAETQRVFEGAQKALDRSFNGSQADKQYAQQRFEMFNQAMMQHNTNLTNTLSSIYNNPNLSASEQAAAAANARAVHKSLFDSYAATMSAGVPKIFVNPYELKQAVPTDGFGSPAPKPPVQRPPLDVPATVDPRMRYFYDRGGILGRYGSNNL